MDTATYICHIIAPAIVLAIIMPIAMEKNVVMEEDGTGKLK
jgi:hypothetical protein